MKKLVSILLAAAFVVTIPFAAAAQHDHGKKKGHSTHGKKDAAPAHGHDEMIIIGEHSVAGVKGMAHISDIREAMARLKMKETHHLMIMFMDEANGAPIEEGTAAVRVAGPDGKESSPVRLIPMEGHFAGDVVLEKSGNYTFVVGTRLPDGQTRQFEFTYMVE